MNTHIFTDREKEVLGDWMTGRQDRNSNSHLHVTLIDSGKTRSSSQTISSSFLSP